MISFNVLTQIVQRFATDPRVRVALLSVTAAGTGLDFSAASHVVFAELPHEACAHKTALMLTPDVMCCCVGIALVMVLLWPRLLHSLSQMHTATRSNW